MTVEDLKIVEAIRVIIQDLEERAGEKPEKTQQDAEKKRDCVISC